MSSLNGLVHGFLLCGFAVVALFFARFWRETRDRFFLLFAAAFFVMATDELVPAFVGNSAERNVGQFIVRLGAFLLILAAIAHKNRARPTTKG